MQFNLFINYYIDKNKDRRQEYFFCLKKNLQNKLISNIFIFCDDDVLQHCYENKNFDEALKLCKLIYSKNRPTFDDYFSTINELIDKKEIHWDSINIISNLDIYFDETIALANKMNNNDCYALSRYNILDNFGNIQFYDYPDSQDCYFFRGKIKQINGADFTQGIAGCDNKIAYLINEAGYNITNPSQSIKSYHLHLVAVRNYISYNEKNEWQCERVPPPYLLLKSCKIN